MGTGSPRCREKPWTTRIHPLGKSLVKWRGQAADVGAAVNAAQAAFRGKAWRRMSPQARSTLIWRLADLMADHLEELAQLDSIGMGMPIRQARYGNTPMAIDHMRYMAGPPKLKAKQSRYQQAIFLITGIGRKAPAFTPGDMSPLA